MSKTPDGFYSLQEADEHLRSLPKLTKAEIDAKHRQSAKHYKFPLTYWLLWLDYHWPKLGGRLTDKIIALDSWGHCRRRAGKFGHSAYLCDLMDFMLGWVPPGTRAYRDFYEYLELDGHLDDGGTVVLLAEKPEGARLRWEMSTSVQTRTLTMLILSGALAVGMTRALVARSRRSKSTTKF